MKRYLKSLNLHKTHPNNNKKSNIKKSHVIKSHIFFVFGVFITCGSHVLSKKAWEKKINRKAYFLLDFFGFFFFAGNFGSSLSVRSANIAAKSALTRFSSIRPLKNFFNSHTKARWYLSKFSILISKVTKKFFSLPVTSSTT